MCVYRRLISPGGKKQKEQDLFLFPLSFRMIYTKLQRQRRQGQSTSQREAVCCFYFFVQFLLMFFFAFLFLYLSHL